MGKVDHLCNRVEPFTFLFWALGNVQYTSQHWTLPAGPVSLHCSTQSIPLYGHSWYMVIVGSILNEDTPAPPFSYLGICFLYI